ncbi:MAG TPA: porin family protein [Bacteroidales bacterium]|nr:porin family protein [Bacteroidales bacterium]
MNFFKIQLTVLLSFISFSLSAQYNTLREWYVGPSAGVSASTITLSPNFVDKMYTLGKNGGLTMRYVSESHFGLQLECNFLESGWLEDQLGFKDPKQYSYSRQLQFVEVPFLMHTYSSVGATRFFLNIGPKFSYLLSESETNRATIPQLDHGKLVERPFQYGILGGGGVEVHIGPTVLGLEGRYCYNLSNLFKDAIGEDYVTSDLQVITLNLYLLFQLSGKK